VNEFIVPHNLIAKKFKMRKLNKSPKLKIKDAIKAYNPLAISKDGWFQISSDHDWKP
jgi:hypothetical protein